jgi:hypothetical protein
MRFPAATQAKQPLQNSVVAELIRRLFTGDSMPRPELQPEPGGLDGLPAALDERVRLVGEW